MLHSPRPTKGLIAAQPDNAHAAFSGSGESQGGRSEALTSAYNTRPGTAPGRSATLYRETCRRSCTVPADRHYVPTAGAGDFSTVSTAAPVPIVDLSVALLCGLGVVSWTSARSTMEPCLRTNQHCQVQCHNQSHVHAMTLRERKTGTRTPTSHPAP